jgi:hypothetical protein
MLLSTLFIFLTAVATASAYRPLARRQSPPTPKGTIAPAPANCNAAEKLHLGHGHDINTGDLNTGGKTVHSPLKFPGGSGCKPAWPEAEPNAPTVTPNAGQLGGAKGKGKGTGKGQY